MKGFYLLIRYSKSLFTFLLVILSYYLFSQNKPGGTNLNVELWLKANDLALIDSTAVTTWQDQSGNNRHVKQVGSLNVPLLFNEGMNYNPKLNFSLSGTYPRLAGETNFVDPTKSYYVFFVSQQTTNTNSYNTVFAFTSGQTQGSLGMYQNRTWLVASSTISPTNSNIKDYMVGSGYFTNQNTNSSISLFTNGIPYNQNNLNTTLFTNAPFVIGSQNANGNNNFFLGDLSEVIVLSADAHASIDVDQVKRINSYLALKYGITLDGASQPDYTDSAGTVIWNGANAVGYQNHIFGLGRDDVSKWYQKQASSYEDSSISVFLNQLEYINSVNTGTISADKNFLLFGSNGLSGDKSYAYPQGTSYSGTSLPTKINRINNKILKAQKTGTINTAKFSFKNEMNYVEYVLVSDSDDFLPTNTRLYPVINGQTLDVTINDGDYIGFAAFRPTFNDANFTTELWLDANELQVADSTRIMSWYDKSGYNRNFKQHVQNTTFYSTPSYISQGMNYNSKLTLESISGNYTRLLGPSNINDTSKEYYVYHVSRTTGVNGRSNVLSFDNTGLRNAYGWNNLQPWAYNNGDRLAPALGKLYGIIGGYNPNINNKFNIYTNGTTTISTGSFPIVSTGYMEIGVSNNNNDGLVGDISEILVISAPKSPTGDANIDLLKKIDSYLALKYGIALNDIQQPNYVDSDGNIIWNGVDNIGYTKNIFGIGRDDQTGLNQKQATNSDFTSITLFLGDLQNTNKQNTATFSQDKSFIILGSNNQSGSVNYNIQPTTSFSGGETIPYEIFLRRNLTLKASNINSVGSVNIKLTNALVDTPYILVSNSNTFTPSTTRIYPVVNGVGSNVVLNHNDYVSFVLVEKKPGGTNFDVELWFKADALSMAEGSNVDVLYDQSLNNRDFYKQGNNRTPRFIKQGMNYNPKFYTGSVYDVDYGMLTGPNNFTDSNKEYYVYHVSYNRTNRGNTGVLFMMNDNSWRNAYGWRYAKVWTYTNGDNDAGLGLTNQYSINASYTPNIAPTSGINAVTYINGVVNNFQSYVNETTGNMLIGSRSNTGRSYSFVGDFSEIIVLSAPKGSGTPNVTDVHKVNSYLALKYGITLDNVAQSDYLDSEGNIIWKGNKNPNYSKTIFGIGRDDLSGFNQKQSTSFDNPNVSVFLGSLQNLNSDNNSIIPNDKNFIVLGSNEGRGYETYDYDQNTSFAQGSLTERVNVRHRYTLKTQKTGSINQVNFFVTIPTSHLLVSQDSLFSPSTTSVYTLTDKVASNVQINDGDYIGFATFAVGPGGIVDGLQLWLEPSATNVDLVGGNNVNVWKDLSPAKNDYSYAAVNLNGKAYPQWVACSPAMNFRPSVRFDNTAYLAIYGDDKQPAPMSRNAPDDVTTFVVYNASSYLYNSASFTHSFGTTVPNNGNSRFPSFGFNPQLKGGRISNYGGGQTFTNGTVQGFALEKTIMQMLHTKKEVTNGASGLVNNDFNGYQDQITPTGSFGQGFRMSRGSVLGGGSANIETFNGLLSEIFFYEKELTTYEQNIVRSYVGAKYGITLRTNPTSSPTVNFNYLLSNGTSVWDGLTAPNQNYHYNVAGLVRDDQSLLNTKVSKSVESGAIVTMQLGNGDSCSPSGGFSNDFSAIFWGNNNVSPTNIVDYTNDPTVCGAIRNRMGRIWLVNKTLPVSQTGQTVTIKASGTTFPYAGPGFEVVLLIADDPIKFTNKNWDQIIPGNYIDGEHQFSYTFTKNNTYFTFAAKQVVGNCESCDFQGQKILNFTRVNWPNGTTSKDFDLGDNFKTTVSVVDAGSNLRATYPRSGANNTIQMDRLNNTAITTTINLKDYNDNPITASTVFEIFNIDMGGNYTLDDVVIKGYCSTAAVVPSVTYVDRRPERSTYSITSSPTQVQATAKARGLQFAGGVGYTDTRGRMLVRFDTPVERIEITYTVSGSTNVVNRIGIGPITFTCASKIPLPEPNEEGLIFTKQAPTESLLCETVDYTFQIINTNCSDKTVSLTDVLPAGMVWVSNSVIMNSSSVTIDDITGYNADNLSINNIIIPGGGDSYYIRATAKFAQSAGAGTYSNTADINYELLSTPQVLSSTDLFTGLPQTNTIVANSIRPVEFVTTFAADVSCFNYNQEIEYTLTITNNNSTPILADNIGFNYSNNAFTLVPGSVEVSNLVLLTPLTDELLSYSNVSIPVGTSTLKFKLKVGATISSFSENTLTQKPYDENIAFNIDIASTSECIGGLSQSGTLVMPFCTYCTQLPVSPAGRTVAPTKFGVSLSQMSNAQVQNWISTVPNAYLAVNANRRGLVITRTSPSAILEPVVGMIIYNTDPGAQCISLYTSAGWKCIERVCNE